MHPHQIADTGVACGFPPLEPPRLAPSDQRALDRRIWFIEAEQAARHWAIEQLYVLHDELIYELMSDQIILRRMREVRLNRGRP